MTTESTEAAALLLLLLLNVVVAGIFGGMAGLFDCCPNLPSGFPVKFLVVSDFFVIEPRCAVSSCPVVPFAAVSVIGDSLFVACFSDIYSSSTLFSSSVKTCMRFFSTGEGVMKRRVSSNAL